MMKKIYILFLLFSFVLFSCGDDGGPEPHVDDHGKEPDGKSMFIVEYEHSGDLDVFYKFLGLGKGFVFYGGTEQVPEGLNTEDLTKGKYKFITAEPIRELEIHLTYFWIDFPDLDYAEMEAKIRVFRDEELIDSVDIYLDSDGLKYVEKFEYEGI